MITLTKPTTAKRILLSNSAKLVRGFNRIWDDEEYSRWAFEAFDNFLLGKDTDGECLYIRDNNVKIGITGWYTLPISDRGFFNLRWHGIIPERRDTGVSSEAIELLIDRLPDNAEFLVQLSFSKGSDGHFKKLGFIPIDDAINEYGGIGLTDIVCILNNGGGDENSSILIKKIDRSVRASKDKSIIHLSDLGKLLDHAKLELKKYRIRYTFKYRSGQRRLYIDHDNYTSNVLKPLSREVRYWRRTVKWLESLVRYSESN